MDCACRGMLGLMCYITHQWHDIPVSVCSGSPPQCSTFSSSKCTKVRIEDTPNKESWLGKHTPNLWSHHSLPLRVDSMYIPGTFTGQNFHETMIHCITEHFRELNLRGKLNPTFTKWSKLTTVCTREACNRDLRHILQHCLYVGIFISAIQTRITA